MNVAVKPESWENIDKSESEKLTLKINSIIDRFLSVVQTEVNKVVSEKDEYLKKQTLESLTLQVKNFFNKKINRGGLVKEVESIFGVDRDKKVHYIYDGQTIEISYEEFVEFVAENILEKIIRPELEKLQKPKTEKNMINKNETIVNKEVEIIERNNQLINGVAKEISNRMLSEWKFDKETANAYLGLQYAFGDLQSRFEKNGDRNGAMLVEYPIGVKMNLKSKEDFGKHVLNMVMNNLSNVNRSVYDPINYPRGIQHTEQMGVISDADKKVLDIIYADIVSNVSLANKDNDTDLDILKKQVKSYIEGNFKIKNTLDRFFKDVNFKDQKISVKAEDGVGFYTFNFDFFVRKIEQEILTSLEEKKRKAIEAKVGKRGLNTFGNTEFASLDLGTFKKADKPIEKMTQAELEERVELIYHNLNTDDTINKIVQNIVRKRYSKKSSFANFYLLHTSPLNEMREELENIFSRINGVAEIRVWGGTGYVLKQFNDSREIIDEKMDDINKKVHQKLSSRKERFFAFLRNVREAQDNFQNPENFAVVQKYFEDKKWAFEDKFAVVGGIVVGGSMAISMMIAYAKQRGYDVSFLNIPEFIDTAKSFTTVIPDISIKVPGIIELAKEAPVVDIPAMQKVDVVVPMLGDLTGGLSKDLQTVVETTNNIPAVSTASTEVIKEAVKEVMTPIAEKVVEVKEVLSKVPEYLSFEYKINSPKEQYHAMTDFFRKYCEANNIEGNIDKGARNFAMNIFERFAGEFTGKLTAAEIIEKASKLTMEVNGKVFNLLDRSLYWTGK